MAALMKETLGSHRREHLGHLVSPVRSRNTGSGTFYNETDRDQVAFVSISATMSPD